MRSISASLEKKQVSKRYRRIDCVRNKCYFIEFGRFPLKSVESGEVVVGHGCSVSRQEESSSFTERSKAKCGRL